jgi:putative heme-binding domain-containing protein
MTLLKISAVVAALLTAPMQSEERPIWTASHITGSPEAPPPLRTQRVFPALRFSRPVQLVPFPAYDRYALVEEEGTIWSFRNDPGCQKPDLFLDLRKELRPVDSSLEGGVVGSYALAFDPEYSKNRFCYLMYLVKPKDHAPPLPDGARVSRFKVTDTDPPRIDPLHHDVLLGWPVGGHNGCDLKFGNDGCLYISTGDAEAPSPPDRRRTGQDISDLLSSILRIDVHRSEAGLAYAIPTDNPFVGVKGARAEVWCYGLRNPWRMSFDRPTGRLWVADVGWEKWESIHCAQRGGNCGWSIMEGPDPCLPDGKRGPTPIIPPAHAIAHPEAASLTGGYVYRGRRLTDFRGYYFCGDWETRRIWALPVHDTQLGERQVVARTNLRIVAFAEDPQGELLIVDHEGGGLYELVLNEPGTKNAGFPRTLGETGLFTSVADEIPASGVIPYEIRAPRWADGARGRRWIAFPNRDRIQFFDKERDWPRESVWPKDSVLANTLSLGDRKLETQILHFDGQSWNGYSYVWNDTQQDALLAPAEGLTLDLGAGRKWKISPRAACVSCHNPWAGYVLTISTAELKDLEHLRSLGVLPQAMPRLKPLADPDDEAASLDDRARSYLAVNCAHCHRFGAGASTRIDLRLDIGLGDMRVLGVRPTLGGFGLLDPYVVCGGDPGRSVLLFRTSKLGQGRMPHIGSEVVDEAGLRLLGRWIRSLPATACDPSSVATRSELRRNLEAGDFDRLLASSTGALDLALSLDRLPASQRQEAIRRALELSPGLIRELFERFEPPSRRRERLGTSVRPEAILSLKGDAERGRRLLSSGALQCSGCHRLGEGPEKLGPDLGKIGVKYTPAQILESILEPSKTIEAKYAGTVIQTKSGDVLSGIVISKEGGTIVLRDAEKVTRLSAEGIERMNPMKNSLMPEGLLQHLTAQEASDLLSYLGSLR